MLKVEVCGADYTHGHIIFQFYRILSGRYSNVKFKCSQMQSIIHKTVVILAVTQLIE